VSNSRAAAMSREQAAYHEAGHAVAAFLLGQDVWQASGSEENAERCIGCLNLMEKWLQVYKGDIYESIWGSCIDGRLRDGFETDMMIILAGDLAEGLVAGLTARLAGEEDLSDLKWHGEAGMQDLTFVIGCDFGVGHQLTYMVSGSKLMLTSIGYKHARALSCRGPVSGRLLKLWLKRCRAAMNCPLAS
jgi:hypothetical protein